MPPRLPLLLLLGARIGVAHAGWTDHGNPPSIRGQHIQAVRLTGQVTGIRLTGRHGRQVQVRLPRSYALTEAIPLPSGTWAELTLVLEGPVTLHLPDGDTLELQVDTLTVPLEDPSATSVHLDWTLPENAGSPTDTAGLRCAIEDGGLAVPAR